MNDPAISRSSGASVSWLVAYSLGLAYSENTDQRRLTELVEVTRGQPELLEAARRRLDGADLADVAERDIREEASRLLDRASVSSGRGNLHHH
jgi:hypothetical protein